MGVCLTMSTAPTVSLLHRCLAAKADTALAALAWTLTFAACTDVLVMPWEVPAAAACLAWLMSLIHACRQHSCPPAPVTLLPAAGLVVLAYTGLPSYLLPFFFPAFLLHVLTRFVRRPLLRDFGNHAAVALVCAAPAAGYSFEATPFDLPQNPAVWLLAGVIWVRPHRTTGDLIRKARPVCTAVLMAACIGIVLVGNSSQQAMTLPISATLVLNEIAAYAVRRFRPTLLPLAESVLVSVLPATATYLLFFTPKPV